MIDQEAREALIIDARLGFVAAVIQLPDRPGCVDAVFQCKAGMRITDVETIQINAGARNNGHVVARFLHHVFHRSGEIEQLILFVRRQVNLAVAKYGGIGRQGLATAQQAKYCQTSSPADQCRKSHESRQKESLSRFKGCSGPSATGSCCYKATFCVAASLSQP